MYGGGIYSYDLAEKLDMPAANFTIGVYDVENSILYYCRYDS